MTPEEIQNQRVECARMQGMCDEFENDYEFRTTEDHFRFCRIARTDWPALIKNHLEALGDVEKLQVAIVELLKDKERLDKIQEWLRVNPTERTFTAWMMGSEPTVVGLSGRSFFERADIRTAIDAAMEG